MKNRYLLFFVVLLHSVTAALGAQDMEERLAKPAVVSDIPLLIFAEEFRPGINAVFKDGEKGSCPRMKVIEFNISEKHKEGEKQTLAPALDGGDPYEK